MKARLAAVLFLVPLAACGGGDREAEPTSPSSTSTAAPSSEAAPTEPGASSLTAETDESAIEGRYLAYSAAFFGGDGATAYELLSARCRGEFTPSQFAPIVKAAAEAYGKLTPVVDDVEVDGDQALVDARFGVAVLDDQDSDASWLREDGEWFSDQCDR